MLIYTNNIHLAKMTLRSCFIFSLSPIFGPQGWSSGASSFCPVCLWQKTLTLVIAFAPLELKTLYLACILI